MQVPSNNSAVNEQNNKQAAGNDNRRDDNDPTSPSKIVNSEGQNEPLDDEDEIDLDDTIPGDDSDEHVEIDVDNMDDLEFDDEDFDDEEQSDEGNG